MPRTARWRRRSTTDPVTGLARAGASSASGAVSTVSLMSSIMSVIMSLEMELSTTISTRSLFSSATSMAGVLVSLMVASLTSTASSLVLAAAGRLEDRKGNVDEDTGAGAWPRTLDRTVDFWTYAAMTSVLQSAVRCSSSWQRMHTKLVLVMAAWLLLGPRHKG